MSLVVLLAFLASPDAFAASIRMYCLRADEQKKSTCYRVVHVLSEEAAKLKEAQGCVRDTGKRGDAPPASDRTKSIDEVKSAQ